MRLFSLEKLTNHFLKVKSNQGAVLGGWIGDIACKLFSKLVVYAISSGLNFFKICSGGRVTSKLQHLVWYWVNAHEKAYMFLPEEKQLCTKLNSDFVCWSYWVIRSLSFKNSVLILNDILRTLLIFLIVFEKSININWQ